MKELTDAEFRRIRDYIKANYGINMGDEKKALIYSRLRATLVSGGFESFTQYFDSLLSDKNEEAIRNFVNKVTTNHTFFMRETDHFKFFRETVLPYIEDTYGREKDVRLWCAACSSGEEPYTLQMIMQDYFEGKGWNTEILATDISANVLDKAYYGVYPIERVEAMPPEWRNKYFKKHDDKNMVVIDKIKKNILFRRRNLMDSFTKYKFKKKMQVIFCRNVMIYFDNDTRNETVQKFYEVTENGGYLFIGHSESLTHTGTDYKYIMPAVYRKN